MAQFFSQIAEFRQQKRPKAVRSSDTSLVSRFPTWFLPNQNRFYYEPFQINKNTHDEQKQRDSIQREIYGLKRPMVSE